MFVAIMNTCLVPVGTVCQAGVLVCTNQLAEIQTLSTPHVLRSLRFEGAECFARTTDLTNSNTGQ